MLIKPKKEDYNLRGNDVMISGKKDSRCHKASRTVKISVPGYYKFYEDQCSDRTANSSNLDYDGVHRAAHVRMYI